MTHDEIKKLEESFDRYKKALALVYADGDVTSVERNRLISLKNELGLSDSDCMVMEARFHETADQDGIKWEELKDRHHCHLCDSDGKIIWNGIEHSMLEYIELGDTYIEASNGSSYTGLREPFVLSIGQSFEELLDEYGENHIYDAIKDGRLQVFDEQKDLETFLKLKFDILGQEEMEVEYLKLLDISNFADYLEEGPRKKLIDNRIDLLNGKTELSQDELYQLVEFKQEYTSNDTLEVFTNKKYRELDNKEKKELVDKLLKSDYLKYKNCYISRSKLLYDSSETLEKEITILEKLNNLGYEVYLLPYAYARDSMNCYLKNADSITNGEFLEFKTVVSTGKNAGQSVYRDARKQADNVFISLKNELSEEKVINNIYATIKESKKHGQTNSFEGLVFLNFEQDNNRTVLYNFDKDGYAIRLENPSAEYLKKIKGIVSDSQVLENPMLEHGSSPKNNIQQPSPVVNSKMSDWEMKYSSLSAEKLISFISDEAFTKEMAAFTLADFEGNGTPLVIDELGNVCEKSIWESKEENAIVDYMPSGITTREIEILEDFLTGHPNIPAKQRVEVLKLKDTLEEINERLIEREERTEEQSKHFHSRTEKEIVKDYLDKIKDSLPASERNIVDEVMKASAKALSDFSEDEKKVIGKYLMENGAKDQQSLEKLLKKKVDPEHEQEIRRGIEIERGR